MALGNRCHDMQCSDDVAMNNLLQKLQSLHYVPTSIDLVDYTVGLGFVDGLVEDALAVERYLVRLDLDTHDPLDQPHEDPGPAVETVGDVAHRRQDDDADDDPNGSSDRTEDEEWVTHGRGLCLGPILQADFDENQNVPLSQA